MPTTNRRSSFIYVMLIAGVLAVSVSPILVRYAQGEGLPTLLIAAGRLTLSALILTPLALRSHLPELRLLKRDDLLLIAASGLLLAIHFVTWIASLGYTSVLVSVVLVTTSPLWVALFEVVFLRARLRQLVIAGLIIAFAGGLLIGLAGSDDSAVGSAPLLGGALALAGAIAFAVYLVIGRRVRSRMSVIPYIWMVYGVAGAILLVIIALTQTPVTGYSPNAYLLILLLTIFPQLIGHSSFNYVLGYLSATYVSIATQMEPIGSAIAAFFLFGEVSLPLQIVGSAAILGGVIVATLGQEKANSAEAEAAEDTL